MMRTSQRVGLGMRAAAIALAGVLLLAGCATQPEPEQDPFDAATAELRAQLEQIDGIADVRHVLNALDFSISYSITDPARAEQATLEVIDTYEASDVPGALKKETAAYDDDAQLSLNIIEVGAPGGDSGLDPSTSTFAAGLRAPELLNSVDCEPQYVQGSSLNRADQPLKAAAGPNYGSVLYFAPENFTLDIVLLPSLAPDGTLLPLDLTGEAVLAAAPVIQADIDSRWKLRDVVVFTQDGSQTYPMRAS